MTRNTHTRLTRTERDALVQITGGLSAPSKMPCRSWSIPASTCQVGSRLAEIPGTICSRCYARKGTYIFASTRNAMARRYSRLMWALASEDNGREWVAAMSRLIAAQGSHFRWHDSGDLQSVRHLHLLADIAESLPHVEFWLPTREVAYVSAFLRERAMPANLRVRLSDARFDAPVTGRSLPGCLKSGAHTDLVQLGAEPCKAPSQGGACLDCRTCWDADVTHVSYHAH